MSTTSNPAISTTRADIYEAFVKWEVDRRAGKCLDDNWHEVFSVEQAAELSAESFLNYLPKSK